MVRTVNTDLKCRKIALDAEGVGLCMGH